MAHAPGTKLVRVCTVSDGYTVRFNLTEFALAKGQSKSDLMRAIEMPLANMNNWQTFFKDAIPFSVAKALMMKFAQPEIERWEASVQGSLNQLRRPAKVTPACAELALQYDALRAGATFKTKDGSVLTIASAAAATLKLRAIQSETDRADRELREAEAALDAQRRSEAERVVLETARVAALPRQRIELVTERGPVTIEMPAEIPQGEREVYTGLILRLSAENAVLVRQKAAQDLQLKGLEGQVSNLRQRLTEAQHSVKEYAVLGDKSDAARLSTVAGAATPRTASPADLARVKEQLKVPALQAMIDDMGKSMSFREGAALVS